jgi:hypothetical protein
MVLMGCKSVSELNKSKVSFREKRYWFKSLFKFKKIFIKYFFELKIIY